MMNVVTSETPKKQRWDHLKRLNTIIGEADVR